MKVIWSHEALERLCEIETWIARNNPQRAEAFTDRLVNRGESLAGNPDMGRAVPEFSVDEIREIIEGNYRIIYRRNQKRIEILTVFEGHQLLDKDMFFP